MVFPVDPDNTVAMRALRIAEREKELRKVRQQLDQTTDSATKERLKREEAELLKDIARDR